MPEEPAELTGADPLGLMANVGGDPVASGADEVPEPRTTNYRIFVVRGEMWDHLGNMVGRSGRDAIRTYVEGNGLAAEEHGFDAAEYCAVPTRNITSVLVSIEERTVREVTFT